MSRGRGKKGKQGQRTRRRVGQSIEGGEKGGEGKCQRRGKGERDEEIGKGEVGGREANG